MNAQGIPKLSTADDVRTFVLRIALILLAVQILFPPKQWSMTSPFGAQQQSLGWTFLFSDPMAASNQMYESMSHDKFDMGARSGTGIAWGQLLLQLAVTGGLVAYVYKRAPDALAKGGTQ